MLPNRLLNQIIRYKSQELSHLASIRQAAPDLEAPYVQLLENWRNVLERTIEAARFAEHEARIEPHYAPSPARDAKLRGLLMESLHQSQELASQLERLQSESSVIQLRGGRIRLSDEDAGEDLQRSSWNEDKDDEGPQPADGARRSANRTERSSPQTPGIDSLASASASDKAVPIGGHTLPPLPYPYNALEPHIDEKTMRIHHDKHHQSYVDGLNKAEKKLADARQTGDFDLVKHWERELAFNGAGHYLHTIFWDIMSPKGGGKPSGELAEQIAKDFGSFDAFKKQFSEAASKVEGSGWAILVWSPRAHRLEILTAEKHQNLSQWDVVPLLTLDVWEHAYYLKHQNKRDDYIKDWWQVVNWPFVASRFTEARKLKWKPY